MKNIIELTASYKPRPTVHSMRHKSGFYKTGACLWGKDTFHAVGNNAKTLCGIKSDEWMKLPSMDIEKVMEDSDFCSRCAAKLTSKPRDPR